MRFWHKHNWTDWAVIDRGDKFFGALRDGWYIVQERHCQSCGKTPLADQQIGMGSNRVSRMIRTPRKDGVTA